MQKLMPVLGRYYQCKKLQQSSRILKISASKIHQEAASTVDTLEVNTFSRDAQYWWDSKGPVKALHSLNKIRVPFIVGDLMKKANTETLENIHILDIGCGGGVLSEALAKCGVSVTGVDAGHQLIEVAKEHSLMNKDLKIKPTYKCTTIEKHASECKNYYDKVVASEVIEHVHNQDLFVKSCIETLKPGGRIYFTCPSRTRLSHFVNILFAENVMKSPVKGTHQYDKFITPRDLEAMLELNGCVVEEIRGFALNMLTNKWKWTQTKSLFFATRAIKVQ